MDFLNNVMTIIQKLVELQGATTGLVSWLIVAQIVVMVVFTTHLPTPLPLQEAVVALRPQVIIPLAIMIHLLESVSFGVGLVIKIVGLQL
ncbi:hypothetical protein SDC9_98920 [bioreactor metagenome]|uniref:Uncharacterized protein n=1 Tax=bioreactor metagenome TaxID=1076179 RepID=A0A645ARE0_9ZZZZ